MSSFFLIKKSFSPHTQSHAGFIHHKRNWSIHFLSLLLNCRRNRAISFNVVFNMQGSNSDTVGVDASAWDGLERHEGVWQCDSDLCVDVETSQLRGLEPAGLFPCSLHSGLGVISELKWRKDPKSTARFPPLSKYALLVLHAISPVVFAVLLTPGPLIVLQSRLSTKLVVWRWIWIYIYVSFIIILFFISSTVFCRRRHLPPLRRDTSVTVKLLCEIVVKCYSLNGRRCQHWLLVMGFYRIL